MFSLQGCTCWPVQPWQRPARPESNIRLFLDNLGQGSFFIHVSVCLAASKCACIYLLCVCKFTGLCVSVFVMGFLHTCRFESILLSQYGYVYLDHICIIIIDFVNTSFLYACVYQCSIWRQGGVFYCCLHWLDPYRLKLDLHSRCL